MNEECLRRKETEVDGAAYETYLSSESAWFWHSCSRPQSLSESEHLPPELQYLHRSEVTSDT